MLIPVILSGGAGSRLWPLSRELYPKQLLPLIGPQTLLQDTIARLEGVNNLSAPMIVCNDAHRFMVAEQIRLLGVDQSTIILEPCGRNTAPAVAVAALHALQQEDDPLLLILPADHLIKDVAAFQHGVAAAVELAQQDKLVTFGIVPEGPETGYGYIRRGMPLEGGSEQRTVSSEQRTVSSEQRTVSSEQRTVSSEQRTVSSEQCTVSSEKTITAHGLPLTAHDLLLTAYQVATFVEKPDLATAQRYLDSGDYYWNSGMFMFRASRFVEELKKYNPGMLQACQKAVSGMTEDLDFLRLDKDQFSACPADSIDYAVMEKTDSAVVIPLSAGWSDIGSWSALWEVQQQDQQGNVSFGDVLTHDTRNSYLHATHRLLAAVGVEDLVVVETADAILVAKKDQVQNVKKIVEQLKESHRNEFLLHRRVNRPWGAYEGIDVGERFQVKRITVNPGASLSLQKHHHRAEHWIVVNGTARIICDDKVLILSENQSTYIPLGAVHRLENPGKIPLEMIEVQSGSYLGEDDIVRYEDDYGR